MAEITDNNDKVATCSNDNLKSKTKQGLAWNLVERFATEGVQFIFGIFLARLLSPDDYGLIAMPLVFLAIAQCFIDSGFSTALIRKPDIKQEDYSTAFYFNVGVGVICYAILFFTSPLIAKFYNQPILSELLKFTALATLFNPLCAVQQAILTRNMDFKAQALISLIGAVISSVVGLVMAFSGFGVWSLVCQQVGGYVIRTLLFWVIVKWRPAKQWSNVSFQYLWGFGSKVLAQGIISNIYDNIYPIVIGKYYSANDLGNYTRARQFSKIPSADVTGVLYRVVLPVFSSIQDDEERLASVFSRMIKLSAFCIFPIMLGLAAIADPLIRVLLTDKWEGCIILLIIMCFNLMWYPIHAINLTILTAKGRSDLTLKLEIIKKVIGVIVLVLTVSHGIIWMVIAGVPATLLGLIVNTYYTKKIINKGLMSQLKDLTPLLICSFIMWAIIRAFMLLSGNLYVQLFGGFAVGFCTYALLTRFFLQEDWFNLLEMMPARLKKTFCK